MLPIKKLPVPQVLLDYHSETIAKNEMPTYNGFTAYKLEKDDDGTRIPKNEAPFYKLREQLLQEQKSVCAYCGQTIANVENEYGKAQMKTEHFNPQNGKTENDLNYQNLLACCLGNSDKKGENHCDSMKSNGEMISIQNPSTLEFRDNEIIYYVENASEEVLIYSINDDKNKDLTGKSKGCLNLNHDLLKRLRFSIYKNEIKKKLGENKLTWAHEKVENLISYYDISPNGKHRAFKDFVQWFLRDWLKKNKNSR